MTLKRQFIAGATCPSCGQIDKVQRVRVGDGEKYWLECVACGLQKDLDKEPTPESEQVATPIRFEP